MRSRSTLFLPVVLLVGATVVAQAQTTDEYIEAEMGRQRIPGLSLAVLKDGEVVKAEGYGLANVELNVPATPETVYKIGSVSKQFIAAGIMVLVQAGRLGLDDPIRKFLEDAPGTWERITIRHLLTHTSGLVREAPGFDPFKVQSDADLIRTAYPLPLRFAPGEKWGYSNLGYFILAEVIHTVTDQPWSEYIRENVFRPAGMHATHTTTTRDSVPNRARGYTDNDNWHIADEWPALRPSGAFLSTVRDLAKWEAVLHAGTILSDATRRQMWTPVTLNDGPSHPYGFGWQLTSVKGRRAVHHGGGMPGSRSYFIRFIDDGLTIIVLMNLNDVDIATIVNGIADIYLSPQASRNREERQRTFPAILTRVRPSEVVSRIVPTSTAFRISRSWWSAGRFMSKERVAATSD